MQSFLRSHAIALGALVLYGLFRALVDSGQLTEQGTLTFDWLIFVAADLTMVYWSFRAFAATRGEPRTGQAWLLIAVSSVGSAIGSSAQAIVYFTTATTDLPMWVHVVFTFTYLLFIVGLLSFPIAPRRRADRITLAFDIATVALSGVMIFWYWSVRTGVFNTATSFVSKAIVIGYPSADLAVLLIAAILLVRAADTRSRSIFGYIALGYLCWSIADFWYGYLQIGPDYHRSTIFDVCGFAAVLLPIFAATSQMAHSARPGAPKRDVGSMDGRDPAHRGRARVPRFCSSRSATTGRTSRCSWASPRW